MDDNVKERILRDPKERAKLQEEIKAKQAEIGVRDMIALRGQDEFQQLDDLHNNAGKIQDQLAAADEARSIREKPRKEEERRRRMEMSEEAYFRLKERKEREAYERRKITIR